MRENHSAYHKIWFRPRILHDVANIDLSTSMLGTKVDIPFYVTATALGKLGNPEGEVSIDLSTFIGLPESQYSFFSDSALLH